MFEDVEMAGSETDAVRESLTDKDSPEKADARCQIETIVSDRHFEKEPE